MSDMPEMLKALLAGQQAAGYEDAEEEVDPPVDVYRLTDPAQITTLLKQLDDVGRRYTSSVVTAVCSWRVILPFVPAALQGRRLQFNNDVTLSPTIEIYSRRPVVVPPSILVIEPGSAADAMLITLFDAYDREPQGSDRLLHYQLLSHIQSLGYTGVFGEQFKPMAFNGQFMFAQSSTSKDDWARAMDDAVTMDLVN